jgi:hypothetical protein
LCPFVEEKEMERAADEEEAEQQRRRAEEEAFRQVARQPAERRKQGQELARIACYPYEQALHQCYETKWFPMITCYEENNAFWDCFKEKRVRMRSPTLHFIPIPRMARDARLIEIQSRIQGFLK